MEHELPKQLSNPAIQALLVANIRSLEEVSHHTQRELLKLHGFGPKGIRILIEAMNSRGNEFAESVFLKES